jgi:hypothetical protein
VLILLCNLFCIVFLLFNLIWLIWNNIVIIYITIHLNLIIKLISPTIISVYGFHFPKGQKKVQMSTNSLFSTPLIVPNGYFHLNVSIVVFVLDCWPYLGFHFSQFHNFTACDVFCFSFYFSFSFYGCKLVIENNKIQRHICNF